MKGKKLVIHESEGIAVPDICGTAIEIINSKTAGCKKVSFAKLIINPGEKSRCHHHEVTEEIYYITEGSGIVIIDDNKFNVFKGHAIFIPIGSKHQIINSGDSYLVFVCSDAPVFDPADVIEE